MYGTSGRPTMSNSYLSLDGAKRLPDGKQWQDYFVKLHWQGADFIIDGLFVDDMMHVLQWQAPRRVLNTLSEGF